MNPFISVIITAYNYGRFIEQTVESVIRQQGIIPEEREIIVVDDGSTDDTAQRLGRFNKDIILVKQENSGQAASINAAVSRCRGDVIVLLDADDYFFPTKLARIKDAFLSQQNVDVVYHALRIVDEAGNAQGELGDYRSGNHFEQFPRRRFLNGKVPFSPETSCIAVRTACFKNITPLPASLRLCADWYINILLTLYAREYVYISETLGAYRIHSANFWKNKSLHQKNNTVEIELMTITREAVAGHGRDLGLGVGQALKLFDSILIEFHVMRLKASGKKEEAFVLALGWHDFSSQPWNIPRRCIKKCAFLWNVLVR